MESSARPKPMSFINVVKPIEFDFYISV
jgi:hypothetical protein